MLSRAGGEVSFPNSGTFVPAVTASAVAPPQTAKPAAIAPRMSPFCASATALSAAGTAAASATLAGPGGHTLTATDPRTGISHNITLHVKVM